MALVDVVQVADALVPRVLTLSSDMLLSDAMRAFRLTRNEFAIVVGPSGFDTAREGSDAPEVEGSSETPADGEDVAAGGTSLKAQTLLAEVGRGQGGGERGGHVRFVWRGEGRGGTRKIRLEICRFCFCPRRGQF